MNDEGKPRTVLPDGWPRPRGYANGMAARGEVLAVAGQIAFDEREQIVSDDFGEQFAKALDNVIAVVTAAGGRPEHIISLTVYVTSKDDYRSRASEVGGLWRERMGKHYPSMALVEVAGLVEPRAQVEIQGLAVLP